MKYDFVSALSNMNIEELKKIPKSDLHNHSTIGGRRSYIENWAKVKIPKPPKFTSLMEMSLWNKDYLKPLLQGREGYEKRVEAAFIQGQYDGVKYLNMSVCVDEIQYYDNSVKSLIDTLKKLHQTYAPDVEFIPEIAFPTFIEVERLNELLDEFFEYDYFKTMDCYGDETKLLLYKSSYRKAKDKGLVLKAHVGEFEGADMVQRVVEGLSLDQVQHGISAINSESVMRLLRDNDIQLNICPTSNLLLSRVENYQAHPIRTFYDKGIKVTINSDDVLIFDQSVTEEYINLYNAGVFNAKELDDIRKQGLKIETII